MKKRAAKSTVIFFSVMIMLTFCSRTIYRSTLAKVQTARPTGGTLKYELTADEFTVHAQAYQYEYMPFECLRPLTIEELYIKTGDEVLAGAPLISFYPVEGEYLLSLTESELISGQNEMKVWLNGLAEARRQIKNRIEQASDAEEREIVQKEMMLLEKGIWNGQSIDKMNERVDSAQAALDYLMELKSQNWIMKAAHGGTICSIDLQEGDTYAGLLPICRLAGKESPVYLYAELSGLPDGIDDHWNWDVMILTNDGVWQADQSDTGQQAISVRLPEGIRISEVKQIQCELKSGYEQMLIPLRAVHDGSVFILENDIGDWGEDILVVRERKVKFGRKDLEFYVISEGVNPNDRVVTWASEALQDGQVVVMDGF